MYDETFNQDDFENEHKDDLETLDIEFPTPKRGPSLDEMIEKYGMLVIEFSAKSLKQEAKE